MARPVVVPYGLSFNKWANAQSWLRPELNWPLPPDSEDEWPYWAASAYYNSVLAYPLLPFPSPLIYGGKEDWRVWAAQTIYQLI